MRRKPRNYTFRPILIHVDGVDDSIPEERYFIWFALPPIRLVSMASTFNSAIAKPSF
jgi:hypothetical protein